MPEFVDDVLSCLFEVTDEQVAEARADIMNNPLFTRVKTRMSCITIASRFRAVLDMFEEAGMFTVGEDPNRALDCEILKRYIASAHAIMKRKVDQSEHLVFTEDLSWADIETELNESRAALKDRSLHDLEFEETLMAYWCGKSVENASERFFGLPWIGSLCMFALNLATGWLFGIVSGQHRYITCVEFLGTLFKKQPQMTIQNYFALTRRAVEFYTMRPGDLTRMAADANANQNRPNLTPMLTALGGFLTAVSGRRSVMEIGIDPVATVNLNLPLWAFLRQCNEDIPAAVNWWCGCLHQVRCVFEPFLCVC